MRRTIRAVAAAVLLAQPGAGAAEDLKPALVAQAEFLRPDGTIATAIAEGETVTVRVSVASGFSSQPPAGLTLFGWLRQVSDSDLPCGQSAESFARTGRLPAGAIFLNDPVIGVVTEDDALVLSDPEFSLASANIMGAFRLDERPSTLVPDPDSRSFLLALPSAGKVLAVGPTGQRATVVAGLHRPVQLVAGPGGGILVRQDDGQLLFATRSQRREIARGVATLRAARDQRWAAALDARHAFVIDAQQGAIVARVGAPDALDVTILHDDQADRPFAIAVLRRDTVAVHYLGDIEAPVIIPLADQAARLVASPRGRVVLAWTPSGGRVNVVDVARSRLVRAVGANAPFTEIAFSENTAFLMLASQTHVGALDLAAIARGEDANFREIQIGSSTVPPSGSARQLLAPLFPMEGMLAVHADSYQGYRIMDGSVMGDAPAMTATSLRGGVPRLVATLDRSFVEIRPGLFETVTALPRAGRFELVISTGLGELNFCSEVPVADPHGPPPDPVGTITALRDGDAVRFRVMGPDDRPQGNARGRITFSALAGGWRASAPLITDAEGRSKLAYTLPRLSGIVVQFDARGTSRYRPLLLEDME